MTYSPKRLLELLRIGSGRADTAFRESQNNAILHVVKGRGRLLRLPLLTFLGRDRT